MRLAMAVVCSRPGSAACTVTAICMWPSAPTNDRAPARLVASHPGVVGGGGAAESDAALPAESPSPSQPAMTTPAAAAPRAPAGSTYTSTSTITALSSATSSGKSDLPKRSSSFRWSSSALARRRAVSGSTGSG